MKVCTDACILGAWFSQRVLPYSKILDLGAGTGLLMLMLAQKIEAEIHGIELDLVSFQQLTENIEVSSWREKLKVFAGDARNYSYPVKYDFIITNPPFNFDDLLSESHAKNIAKHGLELNMEQVLSIVEKNLLPTGSFGILLPFHRTSYFEKLAEGYHFYPMEKLWVSTRPKRQYFRSILRFSREKLPLISETELIVQNDSAVYSQEFSELLKDYYLHL